jgi:soluble lytic murein transglycosylase-like protein
MRVFKRFFSITFLTTFLLASFPLQGDAGLSTYVEKYKDVRISRTQLQKLSQYDHLIRYFSNFAFFRPRYKVSPEFIRALILAESNCNPHAVSAKNALGLGQIIPTTGRQAAKELYAMKIDFRYIDNHKLQNLRSEDLFDPAINILLTCYLISKYNHKFNGKLELVVSAWNAGENIDSLKFGKPAPYGETHNLIGKVNGYFIHLLRLRKNS